MKSFLIIGAGSFGHFMCQKLAKLNNAIMVVDKEESKLSDLLPLVDRARIGDCTKREVLGAFGVESFDVCMVCIKEDFQNSLQVTDLLKDLGAKRVVSLAKTEVQAKFLLKNGADEVVFPEMDMAESLSFSLSHDSVFDFIVLDAEHSILEVAAPEEWLNKSIIELNVRSRFGVSVLAGKRSDGSVFVPGADYVFNSEEHLMIMGRNEDVNKLIR